MSIATRKGHTRIVTMILKGLTCPNKDNGSYEIGLSSRMSTMLPHVLFIPSRLLARTIGNIFKLVPRCGILAVLNEQNKKVILASDGINKLPHTRPRTLWQLQLKAYESIQLFSVPEPFLYVSSLLGHFFMSSFTRLQMLAMLYILCIRGLE